MTIDDACKTVRAWAELFSNGQSRSTPAGLPEAVAIIKGYLERDRADRNPIRELEIAEHLLATREGIRWVMPFVLSAESMEAAKRRKAHG
jgi:hypothetical protein